MAAGCLRAIPSTPTARYLTEPSSMPSTVNKSDVLTPAACRAGWYSRWVRASAERGWVQGPGRTEADFGHWTLPVVLLHPAIQATPVAP
jgi:hypothetical protein